MIICKNRAIFLFLLLIIYLDDAGANKKTNRKAKCAKPKPVKNAVLRDRYANKKKFKEGDKVEYDCELGYTLEGITRKRRCRNTKWTDVRFTCTPTCAKPKEVQNAVLRDEYAIKANFKEGDKVEYDCELGYTIEGITSERWCNNSKWTDVRFTCNLKCAKPKPVQNAVLRDEYADIETFKEGDKVEYDCELGYTIEGITRERWCRNTKWTEVRFTCNQITCSWVPHPDNGRHLDTTYAVGDVMKFECNIGYKLKGRDAILCRIDGQWNPPQGPTCDPILCPTLPEIQHGSIFQDTSDGLANNYESVAEYTCDRDYYLNGNTQLKTVERTCQSDGKWSGKEPICEVPKCNLIEDFYGGSVEYFGRRDLYSQAFYSCDENYAMIPSNVQHSTCENNLRWEPPPPKCFKKANIDVPNDGYLRGWKRGKVSHGESYKICCDKGFEVERDNNPPLNKEECTNIRNNNGTLEPSVACVEEWCETDRRHTEYKHENGSEFTSRIPSNEDVWISCEKWYAFYDSRNELLLSPQKRRCVQGQIKDAPTCIEAKSSLAGYPYNEFTFYKDRKRNRLDRETYIEPNERIEVYCSDGYELYVEFYQEYLDQFTTTSRRGSFDKEKNDFPVCREKRCNPNSLKHAGAKYENKTQVDFSTKIQGGTYIFVFCQDGFAFYDGNGQAIETMQKRQCMKGTIVDAPKCQEAKCSLAEYPSNQYTSYYNLNLKAIIEPKTDYIESSHKIEVYCTNSKEYELYVNASNKYVTIFKTKCDRGTFRRKQMFPVCVEKRCSFEPSNAPGACFVTDDGGNCKREQFNIQSGSSMHIKCKQGYTLFVSKKEVKGQKIITCNKGSHPDFSCTANDCSAPGVNNTEPLSTSVYKHNEEVTYKCNKGYWFSKSKLGKKKIIFFKSTCSLGNWTNHIPRTCEPVACFLNVQAGTEYSIYGTGKDILNSSFVENGTSIGVRCKDGFDLYDNADTLINDTNVVPEVTCHVGEWSNKHWCKERCYIPNRANIQFSKDGENLTINDTIKHMESVNITCTGEQGIFSSFIKCENGTFDQYDKCTSGNNFKSSISTSTMSTASTKNVNNQQQNVNEAPDDSLAEMEEYYDQIEEQRNKSKGCKLSDDERYKYLNMNGDEIKPGDNLVVGDKLTVQCRFIDMYSYLTYDYDYIDADTPADDITISCKDDHTMTNIEKECPEEPKHDKCLKVVNGNVKISNSYYVVSCDKGFSLDLFEPNEKRSNCIDGKLKSVIGGQEPKCIPDSCKVPYDYDTLLSISDRSHVSLSGGSVVEVGDSVYINCSKAGDDMHEPVNRRFKCINGQWIEDERDKLWKFGNNGTFPKCRKTKCEPDCENGGVCLRDDECKCKHFTSGKRCENVICDDKCYANNGDCVGPGKCKCPEGKFGIHCEISACRLPENKNMAKLTTPRINVAIGETVRNFTCQIGHFPSSDRGMTCRKDGSWSDIVTCEKGKTYLISTKTGKRRFAGTDANVYITLLGPKGKTRRIKFWGNFESGDVDEIRTFARDVRPIHSVQIGHDGGILSDWDLEYVSIYVEHMEEFYVFRNIKQQWVNEGNDLTLHREGTQACINSFRDKYMLYPRWKIINGFYLGKGLGMTRRACKQACINWSKNVCNGVYRDTQHRTCYGFSETRDGYFVVEKEPWNGELFFRTCKMFN